MLIKNKNNKNKIHYQSAFSLIEVLVALCLLSMAISGFSELLLKQIVLFQEAEYRQHLWIKTAALVEVLRSDPGDNFNEKTISFWREKIELLKPGTMVIVTRQENKKECAYMIIVKSLTQTGDLTEVISQKIDC